MPSIDLSLSYAINAPDVVAEDFDGQVVILNLAVGHYFSLGGIGEPIWSLLCEGHAAGAILSSIEAKHPELVGPSGEFMARLINLDLLRPLPAGSPAPASIDVDWSDGAPQIEIFEELAELIFADPIHDVDEQAGWPVPRPTP